MNYNRLSFRNTCNSLGEMNISDHHSHGRSSYDVSEFPIAVRAVTAYPQKGRYTSQKDPDTTIIQRRSKFSTNTEWGVKLSDVNEEPICRVPFRCCSSDAIHKLPARWPSAWFMLTWPKSLLLLWAYTFNIKWWSNCLLQTTRKISSWNPRVHRNPGFKNGSSHVLWMMINRYKIQGHPKASWTFFTKYSNPGGEDLSLR